MSETLKKQPILGLDIFYESNVMPITWWQKVSIPNFREHILRCMNSFPDVNHLRLWLSYGAWQRDPKKYIEKYNNILQVCFDLKLNVIPCLFIRYTNEVFGDRGELNLDRILPGVSWAYKRGFFIPYLYDIAKPYFEEERICYWDICHKPHPTQSKQFNEYEYLLLREIFFSLKSFGVTQPIGMAMGSSIDKEYYNNYMQFLDKKVCILDDGYSNRDVSLNTVYIGNSSFLTQDNSKRDIDFICTDKKFALVRE